MERGSSGGIGVRVKENQFSFGHVKFEVPSKSQNGDATLGVKMMSLELRGEVKARKADLGDISIKMYLKSQD